MKRLNLLTVGFLVLLMTSCKPIWVLHTSDVIYMFIIGLVFIVIIGYLIKVAIGNFLKWIKNIFNGHEK